MPTSNRSFDRSDFVQVWLSWRQFRNAHVDLKSYHEAALATFSKAFGIDLDTPPDKNSFPDEDGLHGLFLQVARSYEEVRSPFSSYLCGTPEITEMYQKYGGPLNQVATSMQNLHLTMMVELVERIWSGDVPHRVSQRELEACGHPGWNAPDPVDYW